MMKTMLRLVLLLLFAAATLPSLAAASPAKRHLAWVGIGVQSERGAPPSRWRIRLAFEGQGNARIDYPSLRCGGVLIRRSQHGAIVRYREHIRYGRGTCIDGGTVTAWRRGNRLFWRWSGVNTRYPGIRARATLVLSRHRGR